MKKVILTVIFQFVAAAYSYAANEVKFISELNMAIVQIFDANNKMLCIGVLRDDGSTLTHKSCLSSNIRPIIKFPGKDVGHNTFDLRYYKDIAKIQFDNGIVELRKPDVKYAAYNMMNPVCQQYATTIGWKERRILISETLVVKKVTNYTIETKPCARPNVNYEGHIGDPLFYSKKLVGILAEMRNKINIYANIAKSIYFYSEGRCEVVYKVGLY